MLEIFPPCRQAMLYLNEGSLPQQMFECRTDSSIWIPP